MNHEMYMREAIKQAKMAYEMDEVPIGAIVVKDGKIIGKGFNLRESTNRTSAHAEIEAMNAAGKSLNSWNLSGCTVYVTVEPCQMCAGAMIQAHVDTVVFGANEPNSGSYGSVLNMSEIQGFNHYPKIIPNILESEGRLLMKEFFKEKRNNEVKIKRVDDESYNLYLDVRKKVFVEEQNVDISLEIDEYDSPNDENVMHVMAVVNNQVVGAARYVKKGDTLKVGRVAVLKEYRKFKIGTKLLQDAEKQAKNNGFKRLELGAQIQAIPFYEKNGYKEYGEVFDDAGIDHIMMEKEIK